MNSEWKAGDETWQTHFRETPSKALRGKCVQGHSHTPFEPSICISTFKESKDGAAWVLGKQYLRAATSIGANLAEAQAGESRADFIHKLGIAQKEARESLFWLRLLTESKIVEVARLTPLIKETEELIAVVTAILVSSKRAKLD